MDAEIEKLFLSKINKTESCWNWIGFLDKSDAPTLRHTEDGKLIEYSPRKIALELAGRPPPTRGIKHSCNNKLCVNPDHMYFGDEARFWAKVNKQGANDCWLWTASKDKNGYGKFTYYENNKQVNNRAHRYSYILKNGHINSSELFVCHTCDNPSCVNPDHLWLGTIQENNKDALDKGRIAKGEDNGSSKLIETEVLFIRENCNVLDLCSKFDCSVSTIVDIITYRTWVHLK